MTVQEEKKRVRAEMLAKRRALTWDEVQKASKCIAQRIAQTDVYKNSKSIALYMPIDNEVDVTILMEMAISDGKTAFLPRVSGKQMEFYRYEGRESLRAGRYGILEPISSEAMTADETALIVMPGTAFSRHGARIGYGGGWYDRLLADAAPGSVRLGVAYDFQVLDDLPSEAHDVPLTGVV